jgi:TPR repeat protein
VQKLAHCVTTEICTYVGQPFIGDAIETDVLPQGEVLHRWIDSIIRTRHKFCGQPCLGKHGMMNRYTGTYSEHLVYKHEHHIATIMAIDAMAKLAVVDDDFYDAWAGVAEDAPVSKDFIERVLSTMEEDAYGETKPGMWRVKGVARTILQKNPALVRLAGDIFSLYAPKMDLKKVYSELMVSGGTYRGWEISGLDNFAHVINLTEEEKEQYPELETKLRSECMKHLSTLQAISDIYPTSIRGIPTVESHNNNQHFLNVKYYYNNGLEKKRVSIDNQPIVFSRQQTISFYIKQQIKHGLTHLVSRRNSLIDDSIINELYLIQTSDVIRHDDGIQRDFDIENQTDLYFLYNLSAVEHIAGTNGVPKNFSKAIRLLRESVFLGYERDKKLLADALCCYATDINNGKADIGRHLEKSIELLRESVALGSELAQQNLSKALCNYGIELENGNNGVEKNLPKAIKVLREAVALGLEIAIEYLAISLNNYAFEIECNSAYSKTDAPKSIMLFRESFDLGFLSAKTNLAIAINDYAVAHIDGTKGVDKDIPKAIQWLRKSVDLDYERARQNLGVALYTHAMDLVTEANKANNTYKGCLKIIGLLREASSLEIKEAKEILPNVLHNYALALANGSGGVTKNLPESIKLLREVIELGREKYKKDLAVALYNYAIELANRSTEDSIIEAIKSAQESIYLGYEPAKKTLGVLQSRLK